MTLAIQQSTRATLTAALAFATLDPRSPELVLLHQWLDTRPGIGAIVMGVRRQGWDLQLTGYGNGHWRATFWRRGTNPPELGGSAWEATAWKAVQKAAWTTMPPTATQPDDLRQ